MAGQSSGDLFSQAVDLFSQRVNDYASGIAQRLGSPMSGSELSKDQVLQRWNFSPLGDTQQADAQYHQLVAQGTPPGQALDQVYPYRKTLFSGPDLGSQIDTAQKIAGWAADASGTPPPQPNPNQSPILPNQQTMPTGGPAPVPGIPPAPMPGPGGPAGGLPLPAAAITPSVASVPGLGPAAPPPGFMGPPPGPSGMPGIPAMAGGGVVTQPTVALLGEAGPEAIVPLAGQSGLGSAVQGSGADPNATPDQIGQYIQQAAIQRGIDPGTAIQVALHEGFAQGQPAARGTFSTGSSWWPFQLHYGSSDPSGPYAQYGNVAGLGNDFTAKTGWQPGDPRAWQAATDFALDTVLQRGWYPTFYGSVPAGVSKWQGLPTQQQAA
jgi:hypothetical protein